jgi:hypothetical protein
VTQKSTKMKQENNMIIVQGSPTGLKFLPENAVLSVADSIEFLRPQDVYRLLDENRDHIDELREYITKRRGNNQRILDEVRIAIDEIKEKKQ